MSLDAIPQPLPPAPPRSERQILEGIEAMIARLLPLEAIMEVPGITGGQGILARLYGLLVALQAEVQVAREEREAARAREGNLLAEVSTLAEEVAILRKQLSEMHHFFLRELEEEPQEPIQG